MHIPLPLAVNLSRKFRHLSDRRLGWPICAGEAQLRRQQQILLVRSAPDRMLSQEPGYIKFVLYCRPEQLSLFRFTSPASSAPVI